MQIDPTTVSVVAGTVAMLVGLANTRRQMARDNRQMVKEMIASEINPIKEDLAKVAAKASGAWDKALVLEAKCGSEHRR